MAKNRTTVLFLAIVPVQHGPELPPPGQDLDLPLHIHARVTEQVDVAGLKPAAARRTGSIPVPRTTPCDAACIGQTFHGRTSLNNFSAQRSPARRVVIVGGGFAGACMAVQLVRRSSQPLAITVIDPAPVAGPGLAYSATDPEHRLNAPTYVHSLLPEDAWHFSRWVQARGILETDPQALRPDGAAYVRRSDFGRYLDETLRDHAHWPATGSRIQHLQDQATSLSCAAPHWQVQTAGGHALVAELVVIATGNPLPRLQTPLDAALAGHPGVVENPLDSRRLRAVPPGARVLLIGSGLTALDVLSTLLQQGQRPPITVISRRGLRPKPQGPVPAVLARAQSLAALAALPGGIVLDRLAGPPPAFLAGAEVAATARAWLRALRTQARRAQAEGATWHQPFDDLRDALWQLWPRLPPAEQRRVLRQLRPWYDVHRYRSPPQNQALVDQAVEAGLVRFLPGRVRSAAPAGADGIDVAWQTPGGAGCLLRGQFDALINCTGLDTVAGAAANPLLASALQQGWLRRDACNLGFEVNPNGCAIAADGQAQPGLRVVGPPTLGTFGDPIGAMFIGAQIHRFVPDLLRTLADAPAPPS